MKLKMRKKIRSFGGNIYTCNINIDEAEMDQNNLLENMVEFNDKSISKSEEGKNKKRSTYKFVNALDECRELALNALESWIFLIKSTSKGIKILTPKQMPQGLSIGLAQAKAGNTSEKLLNEIRQIICYLHQGKEITKKVYNTIINST